MRTSCEVLHPIEDQHVRDPIARIDWLIYVANSDSSCVMCFDGWSCFAAIDRNDNIANRWQCVGIIDTWILGNAQGVADLVVLDESVAPIRKRSSANPNLDTFGFHTKVRCSVYLS